MKVYILTEEPYHDNSTILGVYETVEKGLEELNKSPTRARDEDARPDQFRLLEWDIKSGRRGRFWCIGLDLTKTGEKSTFYLYGSCSSCGGHYRKVTPTIFDGVVPIGGNCPFCQKVMKFDDSGNLRRAEEYA